MNQRIGLLTKPWAINCGDINCNCKCVQHRLGVRENFHNAKYKWRNLRAISRKTPDHNSQLASSDVIRITIARTNPCTLVEASCYFTTRNIPTRNQEIGHHRQDSDLTSVLLNTEQKYPDVISRHPPSIQTTLMIENYLRNNTLRLRQNSMSFYILL